MDLAGPEFQSVLDVSSLLKLNTDGDHMKDSTEGKAERWKHGSTVQTLFLITSSSDTVLQVCFSDGSVEALISPFNWFY